MNKRLDSGMQYKGYNTKIYAANINYTCPMETLTVLLTKN